MFSFLCKGVAEVDVERGQELHLWLSPKRPQQRTTGLHWGGPGDWGCQVGFPFFFQKLQLSKSEFLRFKSSSPTGGSQQLEVFGKPVFTEAGNQRENSPIRWTIHFWKLLWSDKKVLQNLEILWRFIWFVFCMHRQDPWCRLEIEPWQEAGGGGGELWKTNLLCKKLPGSFSRTYFLGSDLIHLILSPLPSNPPACPPDCPPACPNVHLLVHLIVHLIVTPAIFTEEPCYKGGEADTQCFKRGATNFTKLSAFV